jgi:hypothetical protein
LRPSPPAPYPTTAAEPPQNCQARPGFFSRFFFLRSQGPYKVMI